MNSYIHAPAYSFAVQKLIELPESPNADACTKELSSAFNDSNVKVYFPMEQKELIQRDFAWRGVTLGKNVKFIPLAKLKKMEASENVWLMPRDTIMQILIDAPIRKKIFAEWLRNQRG